MKRDFRWDNLPAPAWMGVVNVTPNSFSDGGKFLDPAAAVEQARALARDGATILDLGAEASSFFRAGVEPVDADEQWRRLQPVVDALQNSSLLSIDTRSAAVARQALRAGAAIINDISAGTHDPAILSTVAAEGGAIVLMHLGQSFPETPTADDPQIIQNVRIALAERIAAAESAGIPRERIAIDPGIGFGKTMADNWRLLLHANELESLGCPVVLGISRKRFLITAPPQEIADEFAAALQAVHESQAIPRDAETAAATLLALRRGIRVHRVHNVALCRLCASSAPL